MKVFLVLNHFLPQQTAGTEVYTWALSKELQNKGVDIRVIIPNYGKTENEEYIFREIPVFKYAEPSIVDRSLIMGFRKPDGLNYFIELINNENPDIIHFQEIAGSNGINLHHIKAAKEFGAKVIMTFHLSGNSCITGNLFYKNQIPCNGVINIRKCSTCYLNSKSPSKFAEIFSFCSLIFKQIGWDTRKWNIPIGTALGTGFIMENFQERLKDLSIHSDKFVVITHWYRNILLLNGISETKVTFIPQGLPYPVSIKKPTFFPIYNTLRLVYVGRISAFKGLHLLIDAIADLSLYDIQLDIFGQSSGDYYESDLRTKSKHSKHICWKGQLKQEDVVSTMQSYDALCLCSTFSEMSPLVIQEAFAAKIPVIASNVPGNNEQIKDGINGLLFQFMDSNSLKDVLLRCLENKDLLKGLKNNVESPRNFSEVGDEYLTLYKDLLT